MKRILLYLIIFTSLCFIGNYSMDHLVFSHTKNQSPFYLSFASIGAISLESRLDCWAKIETGSSNEPLRNNLQETVALLDLPMEQEKLETSTDTYNKTLKYQIQSGDLLYSITANQDLLDSDCYIWISISVPGESQYLSEIENKLSKSRFNWRYYYLYTGIIEENVNAEGRQVLLDVVMKILDADILDRYEDQYMDSAAAYSPQLKNHVLVQSKKYNVQAAIRSTGNNTKVFIGSPLILGDY